tara:strand:+ start:535 stop:882 length:348 start_codon:yes stop_codon:yes gene_type:complete
MVSFVAIIYILISTFLGGSGALIIKKGVNKHSFWDFIKSKFFLLTLFVYGISTLFYLLALNLEDLSLVYPMNSLVYFWVIIFSIFVLKEKMNTWKWLAFFGIIIGVTLIGLGNGA